MQMTLFYSDTYPDDAQKFLHAVPAPFNSQLLKWVGNKQRFAHEIIGYFPQKFGTYYEPFLGSGAILGTLAPSKAVASDALQPLIEIWKTLSYSPETVKKWYLERWEQMSKGNKSFVYENIKSAYNQSPNGGDLLFLSRSCYGGIVRFRQSDGYMSTPCGVHEPIHPDSFAKRVESWQQRVRNTTFLHSDFESTLDTASVGDLVYCDPPYSHSQSILYGAQAFDLRRLLNAVERAKSRGVFVVLSIDGTKRSGDYLCDIHLPDDLFVHEATVNCGRSMLRRFQMRGETLENEVVKDRLLLTY